jgi:ABC-type hemin transport system substrate-binding protein
MHDLSVIRDRNVRAVVRETLDAAQDGNWPLVTRILSANPDIAEIILALLDQPEIVEVR